MTSMIERVAQAIYESWARSRRVTETWEQVCAVGHSIADEARQEARAAIEAMREPTEGMWGGLARDLVMWDRGIPDQYGSTLYKHLRAIGRDIPDWLLQEIPDIDHTPPKGAVAVSIFLAMTSAALKEQP